MGLLTISRSQIKARAERIRNRIASTRLARNPLITLMWRASQRMGQDDTTHLAAGVAYYALFSLFPLLLGLLAIAGILLKSGGLQREFLDFVANNLPGSAGFIEDNLNQIIRFRGALGAGAIIGLLWSAGAVFGAITRVVNQAYGIRRDRPFYIAKPRQMGMALAAGVLFILSAAASSAIQFLNEDRGMPGQEFFIRVGAGSLALRVVPWAISLATFLLIYKFLPNCRTYWRYIWPGAVVAAVLFETTKSLFVWYLETFAIYKAVYGSLTSVIVFMFWVYLSSIILILGAEISSECQKMYHPAARPSQEEEEKK